MPEMSEELDQIAVVGMAGRFPGAPDVDSFWRNLEEGRESIEVLSEAGLRAAGVEPEVSGRDGYVRAKGMLAGADRFDAAFFGYNPREAEIMDPQHRVFLECAWEALESAGCVPEDFEGRIGVFAGAGMNTYLLHNVTANRRVFESAGPYQTLLASDKDFLATRVAYKLGLTGPAMSVQTACSTSLTAVHLACQSLLNGECDLALAGGVSIGSPLEQGYQYEPGGILSPDGHCRPFDASAGGTVPGNGVGVVVLRRLADARRDGDPVDAVVLGSAINNDGSLKAGYTAPSVDGQAAVVSEALAMAGVDAGSVGYVETHGTGTALGDPIELAALTRAFREDTEETGYCAIGSVKSNIGHLDAAAGVAALIKTVLALRHEAIPASLHFTKPNPELDLESGPFFVNDRLRPWPRGERPRRAGVSSFGIGGTNVHLVLEEAPAPAPAPTAVPSTDVTAADTTPVLLPLSGRTAEAVAEGARRLADHLEAHPGLRLDDLAHTLTHRRRAFGRRAAPVAPDRAGAVAALRAVTPAGTTEAAEGARVAFLFPGQGTQYVDMARGLYRREPVFTAELDRCAELFAAELGEDPRALLFPAPGAAGAAAERLTRTEYAQPALFLVEYALAQQWTAWGVRPDAMVGHSVGEYVAACLAGVFELADAVRLVAARGRLVAAMPAGSMLTVFLSERELAPWLAESAESADGADGADGAGLAVAALNSTGLSVVSGPTDAVDGLERRLKEAAVPCRRLHTSHGFHSPAMDGAVGPLVEAVRAVRPNPPRIPFCSNVTGTWITEQEATDPEYWGRHLRQPVRFADAAALLLADPSWVLLEVGPGHTLGDFVRRHGAWQEGRTVAGSLRHPQEREDDALLLRRGLGALWSAGVPVDRDALRPGADGRLLRLPGYAFQRQRYWVEPDRAAAADPAATGGAPATGPVPVEDWFRTPGWRRLAPQTARTPGTPGTPGTPDGGPLWVVLGDGTGLGAALAGRLAEGGAAVVRVGTADGSQRTDGLRVPGPHARGTDAWSLDPDDRAQAAELLGALDLRGATSLRLVHLFSLGDDLSDGDVLDGATLDEGRLNAARRLGLDSLSALAQALTDARPAVPVTLDVLCRGVHSVTGDEPLRPEQALLAGPCTVIPQELPDVDCRLLDVTGTDPAAPAEEAVRAVHELLQRDPGERELVLRGRHWWVRDFDPLPLPAHSAEDAHSAEAADIADIAEADSPADPPAHSRDGGVYLVTGGLGGVGLALAEQLAEGGRAPVLGLLGRSDFPAEEDWPAWLETHGEQDPTGARIRRLTRLRERGARIALLRADVTDERELGAALTALRTRFGPLNGVVHAAGAPSTGMLARRTRPDADAVLAAKTVGTLLLDRLCADDPLDFLLLCSSVSAVLGGPGQSDYGAANAFLDAFAQWRHRQGRPVTALGWGTWEGVGMAAGLTGRAAAAGPETGHPLLRPVRAEGTTVVHETVLSTADSWIVDDHRLMGHGLVPGTAYLELVRAALAGQAGDREIELHDVLFMTPVIVPDGQHRTVFTTIEERDGRPHFTVRSRPAPDAPWREHATGSASFHERGPDVVRDLAEVLERCEVTEVLETEEEIRRRLGVERFEEGGGPLRFWFGPRWQVLKTIRTGGRRMLATLRLDEAFLADLADYPLHPALLDMAGGVFRLHAEDPYYLPLTYRSLRILHPLTGTVEVAVEIKHPAGSTGETLSCDLELLDPDGRLLVQVTDFTVKRINDVEALLTQIGQTVAEAEAAGADAGAGTGSGSTGAGSVGSAGSAGALAALAEGFGEPEGRAAFARVLAQPELPAQLVVTPQDFTALRRLARSITPALLARELEQLAPLGGSHPRPELATPFVAPGTEREEAVAALWREVLGVEEVGVHDDFFALGGHSLAAVQINTRIRSRFGTELDLRDFFQSPTVAHTVDLLAGGGEGGGGDTIEALSRTGDGGEPGHQGLDDHGPDDQDLDDLDSPDDLDGLSDEEVEARLQALLAEEAAEETADRGDQE
ncbi:SDR family NAD(P)-dependent oxidoreductase [Kitasatospora purpeofusca]|uniref:type I polyketide synthase n=1 Tax=Kitasatospora purpeofusca TaxID=67352 RepID=UPI003863CE4D|nr:SDR family NAD(P)-dependent oxidoreductase [Kitasatospora purpeofusca]